MTPDTNKWYKLTTRFVEDEGLHLEGNRFAETSFLDGAAYMSGQDPLPTGCMWKFIDAGDGYWHMTTRFLEAEDLYLEGNKLGAGSTLKGAAFMSAQKPIPTGCMWRIIASDDPNYVLLTTKFVEGDDLLLEGNKLGEASTLKGAAFMSSQKPVPTGCMWKIIEL